MGIYIKKLYPQLHFEIEQLLDASYNVWHRLTDDEKISLANFIEEMSRESNHVSLQCLKDSIYIYIYFLTNSKKVAKYVIYHE